MKPFLTASDPLGRMISALGFAAALGGFCAIAVAPTGAITRTDATAKQFLEPTKFKNDETWKGVGPIRTPIGAGTGAIISPCHVLTAAHIFFPQEKDRGAMNPNAADKPPTGEGVTFTIGGKTYSARVQDDANKIPSGVTLEPHFVFDPTKEDAGHRISAVKPATDRLERDDLAIITLDKPVPAGDLPDGTGYAINRGEIPDERDPMLLIPQVGANKGPASANAVKVGYGAAGDGPMGRVDPNDFSKKRPLDGRKREMFNTIDEFGDGFTRHHKSPVAMRKPAANDQFIRDNPPPRNTLIYDFDEPTAGVNSSNLINALLRDLYQKPSVSVGDTEGSPASGDSGGPMFQYRDGKKYIVGVTSSGSDEMSRFGTVAYDTRVQEYKLWIDEVAAPANCPKAMLKQDWGDASQARGYATTSAFNGARHLNFQYEWLGSLRDPLPSVSNEVDADDPMDEDGVRNLVNQDGFDDGVILPPTIVPGQPFQITVRLAARIDLLGFGPLGRYDATDPFKRLYLNAWADWQDNGSWHDSGDKIIGTGSLTGTMAIDPETFGPDGQFTPGEVFADVGADGIAGTGDFGEDDDSHLDGEPFVDTAGRRYADFTFTVTAPPVVAPAVTFRFRLDYGEDVGSLDNPISDPLLAESEGPAQYGEVEDYVVENVPPACWLAAFNPGPPLTAIVAVQDLESGLAHVDTLEVDNLTVEIPAFDMGERAAVPITVGLIDQTRGGEVTWRLTDVAGNVFICDPVQASLVRDRGKPVETSFSGIAKKERYVRIINGAPGITRMRLEVNGRVFAMLKLDDREQIVLDISEALRRGKRNVVSLTPLGKPGGTATVIISQ